MLLFFFGYLFVFLDYNITVGTASINLIPDFVGFILLFIASRLYASKSRHFFAVGIVSLILGAWGLVSFGLGLFSISLPSIVQTISGVIAMLGALYLTYAFTEGVKEYEAGFSKPIGAAQLSSAWVLLCMGNLIFYFTLIFNSMYLVCVLLQILSLVWFEYSILSIYNQVRKRKLR